MLCCSQCFNSNYLNKIILSDPQKGDCDFCESTNESVYAPRELIPFFRSILNQYDVSTELGSNIEEAINEDFKDTIFNEKVKNQRNLLRAIVESDYDEFRPLFENKVISKLNKEYHLEQAESIHSVWERFKDEIKNINRFHITNTIDLMELKKFFENETFLVELKKGRIFYRSRVSSNLGFDKTQMGNPPKEKATSGRANPKGISYLYLADSVMTAMYETRVSLFDYVTVGEFKLIDDLKILNLSSPIYDPMSWAENEEIDDYLIYVPFIKTLQKELSLPIRSADKEIDYLPTQYLSEFIKSIGFDGVQFQSSLYSSGYNLAIFNYSKLECIGTIVHEINDIKLEYTSSNN